MTMPGPTVAVAGNQKRQKKAPFQKAYTTITEYGTGIDLFQQSLGSWQTGFLESQHQCRDLLLIAPSFSTPPHFMNHPLSAPAIWPMGLLKYK